MLETLLWSGPYKHTCPSHRAGINMLCWDTQKTWSETWDLLEWTARHLQEATEDCFTAAGIESLRIGIILRSFNRKFYSQCLRPNAEWHCMLPLFYLTMLKDGDKVYVRIQHQWSWSLDFLSWIPIIKWAFFPDGVLSTTDSSNQVTLVAEEDLYLLIFYLDFPSGGIAVVYHHA